MASASFRTSAFFSFVLISALVLVSHIKVLEAEAKPPIAKGLSWTFYDSSCPNLESIIRTELKKIFEKDIGQAAGLHCFAFTSMTALFR